MSDTRPYPLHAGVATVAAVTELTPSMRRLTLSDPLFGRDFGVEQPGEVLTLGWPNEGQELVAPEGGWRYLRWFMKARRTQHWRNFTVRSHDPEAAAIDVDFFLHGPAGRASRWAATASVGDSVGFAGPRVDWAPDAEAAWTLMVADETALPALMAGVETLGEGHRAIAVVEVGSPSEQMSVDTAAHVSWHWLHRDPQPPGTTSLLSDAVAALDLPDGRGQAWGGGESHAIRAVRRALKERAVDCQVHMRGYWKRTADGP